jgi:hypothetical protein
MLLRFKPGMIFKIKGPGKRDKTGNKRCKAVSNGCKAESNGNK